MTDRPHTAAQDEPGAPAPGSSRVRAPRPAGVARSTAVPALAGDHGSAEPASRQLVDAVRDGVASGALARGDRLPPVRTLAAELDLAPNTVAKAYKDLEAEGLLEGRGRAGTFVAAAADDRTDAAQAAAKVFVAETMGRLRLSLEDALELVRAEAAKRG